jgi:hypothetical protein
MTIREYLKHRLKVVRLVMLFVAGFVLIGDELLHFFADGYDAYRAAVLLLSGAIVGAIYLYAARTPCPRCADPLGKAATWAYDDKKELRCPHCGVSLDEPMDIPNLDEQMP